MFSHLTVGSNDLERSRRFYDALMETLGAKPARMDPKGRLVYVHDGAVLLITTPLDGKPATVGNGITVGFRAASPEQADAWHRAGLQAGGVTIEDPPGPREGATGPIYLAYLRDPDGNKLCALHRMKA